MLFNLKEIEQNGFLEVVKIGKKIHISREELIRYLESNTYPAKNIV